MGHARNRRWQSLYPHPQCVVRVRGEWEIAGPRNSGGKPPFLTCSNIGGIEQVRKGGLPPLFRVDHLKEKSKCLKGLKGELSGEHFVMKGVYKNCPGVDGPDCED